MFNKKRHSDDELINHADIELVHDLNSAMQKENHKFLFLPIIFLFLLITTFIIWAYNSKLEEVTRGQGTIIPSSRE